MKQKNFFFYHSIEEEKAVLQEITAIHALKYLLSMFFAYIIKDFIAFLTNKYK